MEWAPERGAAARVAVAWSAVVLGYGLVLVAVSQANRTVSLNAQLVDRWGNRTTSPTAGTAVEAWAAWGQFATLALLVVVCGLAGRRWLGVTVAVFSMLVAGTSAAPPHLLAVDLWSGLAGPGPDPATGWPLRLGGVVQTALLVAPLFFVSARVPRVPAPVTSLRLVAPAAALVVVSWQLLVDPSTAALSTLAVVVPGAVLVVGLLVTGAGPGWFRLSTAPILTTAVWSPWLAALDTGWDETALSAAVLAMCVATMGWLFLLRQVREWRGQPEVAAAPAR